MNTESSCLYQRPSLSAWTHAVMVHGGVTLFAGIPLGTLLYFTPANSRMRRCAGLLVAIGVATAVKLVTVDIRSNHQNYDTAGWMGPFLASTFGFATFFKSIAAAYHQYPSGADETLATWIHWFVALPEPVISKGKFRRATAREIIDRMKFFLFKVIGLGFVLSWMRSDNFASKMKTPSWHSKILNGCLEGWFIYLWASFCLDFSGLTNTLLTGISSEVGFKDPLLSSRSFREAWGARWDLPVQVFLKRSVYVPLRKHGAGRATATMLTFFVSGLLHEYNFSIHNAGAYEVGKVSVFFLCMGGMLLVEEWLGKHNSLPPRIHAWIDRVPSPVVSTLLLMVVAVGPLDALFAKSWREAGAVNAVGEMLPHVQCT